VQITGKEECLIGSIVLNKTSANVKGTNYFVPRMLALRDCHICKVESG
jgi:hypothetical protein